jgi:hypothetical protein
MNITFPYFLKNNLGEAQLFCAALSSNYSAPRDPSTFITYATGSAFASCGLRRPGGQKRRTNDDDYYYLVVRRPRARPNEFMCSFDPLL